MITSRIKGAGIFVGGSSVIFKSIEVGLRILKILGGGLCRNNTFPGRKGGGGRVGQLVIVLFVILGVTWKWMRGGPKMHDVILLFFVNTSLLPSTLTICLILSKIIFFCQHQVSFWLPFHVSIHKDYPISCDQKLACCVR